MSDYVYLKNLNGQQIKPVTDLAAINMTTTNGIGVSTVNGGTIGIIDGYIESAYYTEMADPAVGAANVSSAYVDGGTAVAILGAYTVTSAVNSSTPSQQKIPSEAAVVSALNNVVTSGTSYFAGTGIAIDAGHTVSVANAPTSAIVGLDTQLTNINAAVAAKQDAITAGYRMSLDGTTLNQQRYFPIQDTGTSATITLAAGSAYKIAATTGSKTLAAETIPDGQFGLEGHAEIFIAGAGLIKTTSNVILSQPLEPDSVNNCTIRFHDGRAIISVEDHIAGHVVRSSGSGTDSLKYWLEAANTSDQATQYISVDAALDNTILDFANATVNGEKHLVGNGYDATSVSGLINCGTSKFTVANLSLQDVGITGGRLTLGDAYIPSGSTVSPVSGSVSIEHVRLDGKLDCTSGNAEFVNGGSLAGSGVVDFGGTSRTLGNLWNRKVTVSGVAITNATYASTYELGALNVYGDGPASAEISGVTIENITGGLTPAFKVLGGTMTALESEVNGKGGVWKDGVLKLNGGDNFTQIVFHNGNSSTVDAHTPQVVFSGSNTVGSIVPMYSPNVGKVVISSGAILDLTGNTNATPIAPGGGITFEQGGATVLYDHDSNGSAMASSAFYMMDNVTLPAGAKLTNTTVIDFASSGNVRVGNTKAVSGATIINGSATAANNNMGGAFYVSSGGNLALTSCTISSCTATIAGAIQVDTNGQLILSECVVSNNTVSGYGGDIQVDNGGICTIIGGTYGAVRTYRETPTVVLSKTVSFAFGRTTTENSYTCYISSGAVITNMNATGTSFAGMVCGQAGGIHVVGGTVTYNGGVIEPGDYTSITSDGQGIE